MQVLLGQGKYVVKALDYQRNTTNNIPQSYNVVATHPYLYTPNTPLRTSLYPKMTAKGTTTRSAEPATYLRMRRTKMELEWFHSTRKTAVRWLPAARRARK